MLRSPKIDKINPSNGAPVPEPVEGPFDKLRDRNKEKG